MNKLLSLLLLLPLPASSSELFHTHVSMQCMKEKECTVGVVEVELEGKQAESREILNNLNEIGVEVYRAIPQYFKKEFRAVYYSDKKLIFINMGYVYNKNDLLEVLRHEGWHVAQDCEAGFDSPELTPIYEYSEVPQKFKDDALERYGFDPFVIKIETEAIWAMYTPKMTINELEKCKKVITYEKG